MKVLADVDTGAIVGAQFMCEHATDMISEISVAIANGLSAKQMLKAMRPHPTFEEGRLPGLLRSFAATERKLYRIGVPEVWGSTYLIRPPAQHRCTNSERKTHRRSAAWLGEENRAQAEL